MKLQKTAVIESFNKAKRFALSSYFAYGAIIIGILFTIIFFASASAMTLVSYDHPYIEKLYIESNGINHIYGFNLCAGDERLHFPKILISSDSQIVNLDVNDVISKGNCKKFGIQIIAHKVNSIQANIVEPIRA